MGKTSLHIRPAAEDDIPAVASILSEAATWLHERGIGMWRLNELSTERITKDVLDGLFHVADAGHPVGTIKFQLTDDEFWPDVPHADSAFVHRLAVRRAAAGQGVSTALLAWAARQTAALGRRFLRLDCEASRLRLRAVYERFGFRHHSDRQVGPYFVARYELDVRIFGPASSARRGTGADCIPLIPAPR